MKKLTSALLILAIVPALHLFGCVTTGSNIGSTKQNREVVKYDYVNAVGKTKQLKAVIRVPKMEGKKKAIVILHHGGGWSMGTTKQYAEYLEKHGFITLEPRMFHSKAVNSYLHLSQAFGALKYLAERDDVDKNNISVMGLSYGGFLTVFAATEFANQKLTDGSIKFKSHAAFYPLCGMHKMIIEREIPVGWRNKHYPKDFEDKWIGSPMQIFAGEKDDYDDRDPLACRDFVTSIPDEKQKSMTSVVTYPTATHGWDQAGIKTFFAKSGCKFKGCQNTNEYNSEVTALAKEDLLKFLNGDR